MVFGFCLLDEEFRSQLAAVGLFDALRDEIEKRS
jgi:hypothetical protein